MMARLLHLVLTALGLCIPATAAAQTHNQPLRDGDRVLVKIWTDSVFADTSRVQHSGTIVLPRLGTMSIAGLPSSEIQDSVQRAYGRLIREATVEVTPLRKVTVFGEVRRPAIYYLETQSSMRDAIAMAGGINDIGVIRRITLIRDSVQTRMKDWQRKNGEDAVIRSGDILIVDRESWFKRNAFTVVSGTSVLLSIILTLSR